jgi:hypothetical protein
MAHHAFALAKAKSPLVLLAPGAAIWIVGFAFYLRV